MSGECWFNHKDIPGIEREVTKITTCYDALVRSAIEVSTVMSNYINISGKWNDDNSNTVANWWNNTSDAKKIGKLVFNESRGLEIVGSADRKYCGEMRIRIILNQASVMFWAMVCEPLYASVTNQFDETFQREAGPLLKKCLVSGGPEYEKECENLTSLRWEIFREQYTTNAKYKPATLKTDNSQGGTQDKMIFEFRDKICDALINFLRCIQDFRKSFDNIRKDNSFQHRFFGIEDNSKIAGIGDKLFNLAYDNVLNFKTDILEAVNSYSKMLSSQFIKYLNEPLDM